MSDLREKLNLKKDTFSEQISDYGGEQSFYQQEPESRFTASQIRTYRAPTPGSSLLAGQTFHYSDEDGTGTGEMKVRSPLLSSPPPVVRQVEPQDEEEDDEEMLDQAEPEQPPEGPAEEEDQM